MGTTRIIWRSPAVRRQVRHVVCTAGVGSRDLAARFVTTLGAARGNRRGCGRSGGVAGVGGAPRLAHRAGRPEEKGGFWVGLGGGVRPRRNFANGSMAA